MFDAGWLLLPISGDIHWTLAAIRGVKKPNFDENDPVLTMLHFNSLLPGTGTHDSTTIVRNLSAFMSMAFFISKHAQEQKASMEETVQHFKDMKVAPANYHKKIMRVISVPNVPQQHNGVDCGYYMLRFARELFQYINDGGETGSGPICSWSPTQCTDADIEIMREELKTLVDALAEEYKRVGGEVSENTAAADAAAAAAAAASAAAAAAAAGVVGGVRGVRGGGGGEAGAGPGPAAGDMNIHIPPHTRARLYPRWIDAPAPGAGGAARPLAL